MTVWLLYQYEPGTYNGREVLGVFASYHSAERALWRAQDQDDRLVRELQTDPHDFALADMEVLE